MNIRVNRQELGRYIPADVRREVRRRSKFGCVVCRRGFYHYEHLSDFVGADEHNPDQMCLLCPSCHGMVTSKQWSKAKIRAAYELIQRQTGDEAGEPRGPLDFHTGAAVLAIGDLEYSPAVETVLRYFGEDLIKLTPGLKGQPGLISAVFTDDDGSAILELQENEFVGSLEAWDIEIEGQRIAVRKRLGVVALQLRLEPPGRIVIERLDMRIGDHHILASEYCYAVGVHHQNGDPIWYSPQLTVTTATPWAVAIELNWPQKLIDRFRYFKMLEKGKWLATADERFIMHSPAGVMCPELAISIATGCSFHSHELACGSRSLSGMRNAVFFKSAREMRKYIAIGE